MNSVQLEPFKLIGISKITNNQGGKALKDIGLLWEILLSENLIKEIPNKISEEVYSLYTDYEGDHNLPYRVILGCPASSLDHIPNGMIGREFMGGNYVEMNIHGNLNDGIVVKKWEQIWTSGLDRAYTADFEVYGRKTIDPENAEVNFYIAVK